MPPKVRVGLGLTMPPKVRGRVRVKVRFKGWPNIYEFSG